MANDIIPLEQLAGRVPAKMAERRAQGMALNRNFQEGIRDAFPTLSIKGKVFRFRHAGLEQAAVDEKGYPRPYLDVILVDASPYIAKTFYDKGYVEGDMDPPDCWSLDSIKPDPSVVNKVNPTCLNCPMNQFGSRVTPDGKQAKRCSDQRRMAITLPHHLDLPAQPPAVMSRVPQSSLKNLKTYSDQLDRYGAEINGVITRISFDQAEAFPKLKFEYAGLLTDEQYDRILDLAESEDTRFMLASPIQDPSSDNLDATQVDRTAYQRPAAPTAPPRPTAPPAGNVTPLRPQPSAPVQPFPAQAPVNPLASPPEAVPGFLAPPAPATPSSPPAAAPAQPAAIQTAQIGGLVALGDGKFWNPIAQALCDAHGNPIGAAPPAEPVVPVPPVQTTPQAAPMTAAQAEAVTHTAPTWTPPPTGGASIEPPQPPAPAATPGKRTRRAPGAAPAAATEVQAAPPALDSLLSSLQRQ